MDQTLLQKLEYSKEQLSTAISYLIQIPFNRDNFNELCKCIQFLESSQEQIAIQITEETSKMSAAKEL